MSDKHKVIKFKVCKVIKYEGVKTSHFADFQLLTFNFQLSTFNYTRGGKYGNAT